MSMEQVLTEALDEFAMDSTMGPENAPEPVATVTKRTGLVSFRACRSVTPDGDVSKAYNWQKMAGWTGKPVIAGKPAMHYFQEATDPDTGETIPAAFFFSVCVDTEDGPSWEKVRLLGDMADHARQFFLVERKRAFVALQGYVKSNTWTDRNGNERVGHTTTVPIRVGADGDVNFVVLRAIVPMKSSGNPFADANSGIPRTNDYSDLPF